MANVKTVGVAIGFKGDGKTWSATLSGMKPEAIADADDAKEFAAKFAGIVAGDVTSVKFVETTNVDLGA